MRVLLSTTYFGPIQWYQKLNRADVCYIEACESFLKQTYRNRCVIATTNGLQALTVPVERGTSRLIRDTRISDHNNWRHLHWNALLSAYGESPFFEFYADDIAPFFEKRWTYLLDFNMEITLKMAELIDIQPAIRLTERYVLEERGKRKEEREMSFCLEERGELLEERGKRKEEREMPFCLKERGGAREMRDLLDFREAIRPKHPLPDPDFTPRRYYQVYEQKHGFQPNLSILDLLFNEGPEAILYL